MFELDFDMLKEQGLQMVDTAKKTALDLAGKGKVQLDLVSQQARLSKAQRQLGALVYSLHKSGEENQPLVDKYIEAVAEVEKAIEDLRAQIPVAAPEAEEAETTEPEAEEAETTEPEAEEAETTEPEAEEAETAEPEAEEEIEEEPVAPRGEIKTCPVCQAEIDADALFCTHCGAQL